MGVTVLPDVLQAHLLVNETVAYAPYRGWDFSLLPQTGNCAVLAWNKVRLLKARYGSRVQMAACWLNETQSHAFVLLDNQVVLDEQPAPRDLPAVGCQGTVWKVRPSADGCPPDWQTSGNACHHAVMQMPRRNAY